mmetsp:Transcript_82185/g.137356  ORF Transcript_82185/g.137356 Transcript_82185/m.137356 type:complete len:192 (+) Transcript_82185:2-577(+)
MTISVPARILRPTVTKYTGRFTFLTVQSNFLGVLYFLGVLLSGWVVKAPALEAILVRTFPLCFSLGFFLTPAYYVLDHFQDASKQIRQKFSDKFPYVYVAAHLEHCFAAPAVVLYARFFTLTVGIADILFFVGGYASFYVAFSILTKCATGEWVYPVFDEVEAAGGKLGIAAFFTVLVSLFVALGFLGTVL